MSSLVVLSLFLITITAIWFYKLGLRTDIEVAVNQESFRAGIEEGVSGTLKLMEEEGIIRRNETDDDYEMPSAVSYDEKV